MSEFVSHPAVQVALDALSLWETDARLATARANHVVARLIGAGYVPGVVDSHGAPFAAVEPEGDEPYRARVLDAVGPHSTNTNRAHTAVGVGLDAIGRAYGVERRGV